MRIHILAFSVKKWAHPKSQERNLLVDGFLTRSICKYAVTVRKREDLATVIKKAFYIARTGKPGPVVVDLPNWTVPI